MSNLKSPIKVSFQNCPIAAWESEGQPEVTVGMQAKHIGNNCVNEACQGHILWADGTEVLNIRQGYFDLGFKVVLVFNTTKTLLKQQNFLQFLLQYEIGKKSSTLGFRKRFLMYLFCN